MEKRVNLKSRLNAICHYVTDSRLAADIGCDHGRLSIALLQRNRTEHVLACDISADSLKKAEILRDKCGLRSKMTVIHTDGLYNLPDNPDTIVIAGMGGKLIADILEKNPEVAHNAQRIIMQPMRGIAPLREFLHKNGYHIDRECMVKEGRFYQVISARFRNTVQEFSLLPEGFYECGEYMVMHRDGLLAEYLVRLEREVENALQEGVRSGTNLPMLQQKLDNIHYVQKLIM